MTVDLLMSCRSATGEFSLGLIRAVGFSLHRALNDGSCPVRGNLASPARFSLHLSRPLRRAYMRAGGGELEHGLPGEFQPLQPMLHGGELPAELGDLLAQAGCFLAADGLRDMTGVVGSRFPVG
ncbi:hypothetical protein AB0M39_14020 [Streptomyces sp. NPDC051907]|uniref:hypothetical protein n=1 Tax=Streptomyces sp. NPDC051907 TaxID=3155284 RepID=UPI0034127D2B